jgi:UDP-N-acetylglucosamine/UDP-N-acetylgalactosamine 4-epimerase
MASPWVLTGCAGFIGSHLLEKVLLSGHEVIGVDDLSHGTQANLDNVRDRVGTQAWSRFDFRKKDIREKIVAEDATRGASVVLHNAALGSVPRSMKEPELFHAVNADGTFRFLEAARKNGVKRFVFASSSSVYGSNSRLPKVENEIGEPLSPYAATKRVNEIDAAVYARCYGLETVGLRYFNVFGPRQNPNGAYAAVIPRWIEALREGRDIEIYGDGSNSRDFCFVENVVEANYAAATTTDARAFGKVFNIACGARTDLKELAALMMKELQALGYAEKSNIIYRPNREGDIPHSHADISLAEDILTYRAKVQVPEGLSRTIKSYLTGSKG